MHFQYALFAESYHSCSKRKECEYYKQKKRGGGQIVTETPQGRQHRPQLFIQQLRLLAALWIPTNSVASVPLPHTNTLLDQLNLMPAVPLMDNATVPVFPTAWGSLLHLLGYTFTSSCNVLLRPPSMEFHPAAYYMTSRASGTFIHFSITIERLNGWNIISCVWWY